MIQSSWHIKLTFIFCKFIYFNWRLITLQYCSGFCHTFTWISHGCTCIPHPEPSSDLLPHPIPHGHPCAPALSALFHALNLDWSSSSHIVIYMFQCYSLNSSYPCLLPQSPKVYSLYLCLFCCLTSTVIVSKFHIYVLIYCIGVFSFWLTSICIMGSSSIHLIRTDSNVFFLTFRCVYVSQFSYPFVWQWTFRLLPCPGYCKQCCSEHWVHVSPSILVSSACRLSSGIAGS